MAKEKIEQHEQDQRDRDHAGVVRADQAVAEQWPRAEWGRKRLDAVVPDEARRAVEDREQRDEHHDVGQDGRIADRLEDHALDNNAGNE